MRNIAMFSVLVSTLLSACAAEDLPEDELAGESSLDGESGKGDSAAVFTFFAVRPDERGGFSISRLNREDTICGFSAPRPECYVRSIDWSRTNLPSSIYLTYESKLRAGESIILRGDIVPTANDEGVTLSANEVWLPRSETGTAEGTFTLAKRNSADCSRSLCAGLTEARLNANNRQSDIGTLNLAASGAEPNSVTLANARLATDGVLVAGDRYFTSSNTAAPFRGRRANQFWTRAVVNF